MTDEQPTQPTHPPPPEPPGSSTAHYPAGSPPPTAPPTGSSRGPRLNLSVLAHSLALVLIVIGVIVPLDEKMLLRTASAWAGFAILSALAQLTPLLEVGTTADQRWTVAAAATGALVLFWVSVVQPYAVGTNGFLLTMGVAAAAVGTFTSPHRRWPAIQRG